MSPSAGVLFFSQLSIPPACVPAEEGAQTHRAHDGGQQQGHDVPRVVGFRRGYEEGEDRQQSDGRCVRQLNFGSHVDAFALFLLLLPHPPPLLLLLPRCRASLSGSRRSVSPLLRHESGDASFRVRSANQRGFVEKNNNKLVPPRVFLHSDLPSPVRFDLFHCVYFCPKDVFPVLI